MRAQLSLLIASAVAITFCLTSKGLAQAQPDAEFAKANAAYAAKNYRAAIDGYEKLVKEGHWSASLFYDLGNAYFRSEDSGRAILNYQRALALQPAQPEAQANLQLVRDQSRALELNKSWPEEHLAFLTTNQYACIAAAAFWAAAFILVGLLFARRRAAVWIFTLVLLLVIGGGSVFAISAFENGSGGRDVAIVVRQDVQARLATAENAGTVLVLPPGSEVRILSTRGAWSYAALPNDLRGWIPADSAELVRL